MIVVLALALVVAFVLGVWLLEERLRLGSELHDVDQAAARLVASDYRDPFARAFFEHRALFSTLVWAVLGAIAWLDHGRSVHAQQAAVFSGVLSALGFIVNVFETVGAAIADALVAVVSYLATAVVWILKTLGNVILSTGSVFAKAWDAIKIVWNDALKPALLWIDRTIGHIATWLKKTLAPLFTFLRHVRDELTAVYKRFLRPFLNVIDFVHKLDRLLQVFHITILRKLDATLQQVEQRIDGVLFWIYARLNDITNVLTTIVTADGFFQRETLVKSLARDVTFQWRILTNSRRSTPSSFDSARATRAGVSQPPVDLVASIDAYWNGESNDTGDSIDASVARGVEAWDSFG